MLLSNQIINNMKWNGGGGGGCDNELLGVTSNKQSLHSPDGAAFMNPYAHTVCLECNYINVLCTHVIQVVFAESYMYII